MRALSEVEWAGPGTRGTWVDSAGKRHWLYQDDEPRTIEVGGKRRTVLSRVCVPSVISLIPEFAVWPELLH